MCKCIKCGRELTHNETGLHKKLINRAAESFMCISCLSRHFGVSEEALENKILQFKEAGCMLFR